MSTAVDIVRDTFETEQKEVETTLHGIMDAVQRKDFACLAAHHLYSPKFSKFDDFEPLERQDAATAQHSEEEGLVSVENFHCRVEDLKIDGFDADGEAMCIRARSTMVFVKDSEAWRIAHEHFSTFKSNP